jgi:5-methylcytosine-specific restriction endonuclease McrA
MFSTTGQKMNGNETPASARGGTDCPVRMSSVVVEAEACPETPWSALVARVLHARFGSVPEWVGLLALVEDFIATWDDPRLSPKRAGDRIYIRDGWRCTAPHCTSRRNLEEHHVLYRSRGGTEALSNRICLCRFHHQQGEHGGLARCRGEAPLGITWRLGWNGMGGTFRNERMLVADPGGVGAGGHA